MLWWFFGLILAVAIIISLGFATIDKNAFDAFETTMLSELSDQKIAQLINANPIGNLPTVKVDKNFTSFDPFAQNCANGMTYLGDTANTALLSDTTRVRCQSSCGPDAKVIPILDGATYLVNGESLAPGVWCIRNPPECDFKTQTAVATPYGEPTCLTRFPNLADPCTDEQGQRVATLHDATPDEPYVTENDPDRFKCIEPLLDVNQNHYIEQPANAFRMRRNPCTFNIIGAVTGPDGVQVGNPDTSWYCDCGHFDVTRVRRRNENDFRSGCTSCFNDIKQHRVGYPCWKYNTSVADIARLVPCPPAKFADATVGCVSAKADIMDGVDVLQGLVTHPQGYIRDNNLFPPPDIDGF